MFWPIDIESVLIANEDKANFLALFLALNE